MQFEKMKFLAVGVICLFVCNVASADAVFNYQRSSLHMVLIDSDFPNKEAVIGAWDTYPFPNKYNNHIMPMLGKMDAVGSGDKDDIQAEIEKYIKDTKMANKLVEKWYGWSDEKNEFNTALISERGFYNASELSAGIAKGSAMGRQLLADAGENLIKNTFVTFTRFNFISNEIAAQVTLELALAAADQIPVAPARSVAQALAQKVYNLTKDGYSVVAHTWLYQLNWNDSVQGEFYSTLYSDKQAFDKSEIFTMKYLGTTKALRMVPINPARSDSANIGIGTVRAVDRSFVDLQRAYEVFMPMVPILTVDPMTADVGTKEGLEGGEKFNILEMVKDGKTGITNFDVVGNTSIEKGKVKNNNYNAGEPPEPILDAEGKPIETNKETIFKKSKKAQPGMLLKQTR